MKKSLIALAALAAVTAASAQSSVTISGGLQAGFQQHLSANTTNYSYGSNSSTPTTAALTKGQVRGLTTMDGNINFSVVEDLGGGLAAFGNTNIEKSQNFRGAFVAYADTNLGLRGGFGQLQYSNTRSSDTFAAIASGAISLPDGLYDDSGIASRIAIDALTYTTPDLMPGLKVSFAYIEPVDGDTSVANQTVTAATGRPNGTSQYVIGSSYTNGPLTAMVAYKAKPSAMIAGTTAATSQIGKANMELAALYNAGVAVIGIGYDSASLDGSTKLAADGTKVQTDRAGYGMSATVPMGALSLGLEYWKRGASTDTKVGATYALSKRTSLTAASGIKDYPKLNNSTNVTSSNQYRLSVKHTF
jgi:predicted porin